MVFINIKKNLLMFCNVYVNVCVIKIIFCGNNCVIKVWWNWYFSYNNWFNDIYILWSLNMCVSDIIFFYGLV